MWNSNIDEKYNRWKSKIALLVAVFSIIAMVVACARMGAPDGGWYDETPPKVVGASPADKDVNVFSNKIEIYFNEFVKIDNPTENVVVSPPQLEMPEIKGQGKRIIVELKDTLKPNTTYTVDFSDAISDNNEGNPLGNYTYSFSTSEQIDTMEVAGHVLQADNLEPVKGILVGLYSNLTDTIFKKEPMLRVSKTDSRGRFIIKGVAPGNYRVYALKDADGNYIFNQQSEQIAFSHDIIVPSFKPDIRQDTIWRDSLHIDSITRTKYTHFLPDDIALRAFTETLTNRYLIKIDRTEANHFTLFFSYGNAQMPLIKGLNFDEQDAFIIEANEKKDTINYWIKDTTLVNQDTLRVQMQYLMSDSAGVLYNQIDTLDFLAKNTYEKRMKAREKAFEDWQKKQDRAKKRDLPYDSIMRPEALKPEIRLMSEIDPNQNIGFIIPTPLEQVDTNKIHLYAKHDTLWYKAPYEFRLLRNKSSSPPDSLSEETLIHHRNYELMGEWRPDIEYSLELDSAAFTDIYGQQSGAIKKGFRVKSTDEYSSIFVTLSGMDTTNVVVQLLNRSDKVVKEVATNKGTASFFYVNPDTYYLRMFVDNNNNGLWDTGNYDENLQAEEVYYYPEEIECKAKWDVPMSWNPKGTDFAHQKPSAITQQKADQTKRIGTQNAKRAQDLGIPYEPPKQ